MRTEIAFTDAEASEALLAFAIAKGFLNQGHYAAYAIIRNPITQDRFVLLNVRDAGLPRDEELPSEGSMNK